MIQALWRRLFGYTLRILRVRADDIVIVEVDDRNAIDIGKGWARYLHESVWPDRTILVSDKSVDVVTLRGASEELKNKIRTAVDG